MLGLLIALSAVTGIGLAFRPQLEPQVYAGLMQSSRCVQQVPLDGLVAAGLAAHPSSTVNYIRVYSNPGAAARLRFANNDTLYLDRCSGKVLGEQNRYRGLFGRIEQLHTMHYWKIGPKLAGSWALGFAVLMICGGIYVVLPLLRARWKLVIQINWRLKRRAWNLNLHRTLALYASPIFLMSALTALPQAFEWVENSLYALDATPTAAPPRSAAQTGPRISIDAAWREADKRWPKSRETLIHIPNKPGDAVEIIAIARDAWHDYARNYLYLDANSGGVLSVRPYEQLGAGSKVYYAAISLHTGLPAGLLGQIIMALSASTLIVVIYAGFASYLRSRQRHAGGAA